MGRETMCRKPGLWGIAMAMLAAAVCGAPAAGQSLLFEPPLYRGSAEGVPLAGQDRWYVPGGADSEWRVYHNGGSELGLAALPAGGGQVAGVALEAPIGTPQQIEHSGDLQTPVYIIMHVVVDFDPSLPAGEEIGRMTLEPEGASASFGWVARRDAGAGRTWAFELLSYMATGERQRKILFEELEPGAWHELRIFLSSGNWVDSVMLTDLTTWRRHSTDPLHSYLAGGAAGGLPAAAGLRLAAGAGESPHAARIVVGIDNLLIGQREPCYQDCDYSGELDFFDFLCFQSRFAGGDPYADCDESGVLDFFDFLCFINEFHGGGCGP